MSVAGKWQVRMDTPIGTQSFTWTFQSAGGPWQGTMEGAAGSSEMQDVRVEDGKFDFKARVASPMGMLDLNFDGAVAGSGISGSCRTQFGTFQFSGQRA